jgi:hypothetical protein
MRLSWRKQESHARETRAVRQALNAEGIKPESIRHGRGTAWEWLEINLGVGARGNHALQDEALRIEVCDWQRRRLQRPNPNPNTAELNNDQSGKARGWENLAEILPSSFAKSVGELRPSTARTREGERLPSRERRTNGQEV